MESRAVETSVLELNKRNLVGIIINENGKDTYGLTNRCVAELKRQTQLFLAEGVWMPTEEARATIAAWTVLATGPAEDKAVTEMAHVLRNIWESGINGKKES